MQFAVHTPSAFLGAGVLALAFLAGSASQQTKKVVRSPVPLGAVKIIGIPGPRDMLLLKQEDGPYTVPPGKDLVVTGLGDDGGSGSGTSATGLYVDGVRLIEVWTILRPDSTLKKITPIRIHSGSQIQLINTTLRDGRAVGYLAAKNARQTVVTVGITRSNGIEVVGIPAPRDMLVLLEANGPYLVPVGRMLVLTGVGDGGAIGGSRNTDLLIDGVRILQTWNDAAADSTINEIPAVPIPGGSTVTLISPYGPGRAVGYLADA